MDDRKSLETTRGRNKWISGSISLVGVLTLSLAWVNCAKKADSTTASTSPSASPSGLAYIYVSNNLTGSDVTGSLSAFTLDSSGTEPVITSIASPSPAPSRKVHFMSSNAAGNRLYFGEMGAGGNMAGLRVLSIDASTGSLTTLQNREVTDNTYVLRGVAVAAADNFALFNLSDGSNQYRSLPLVFPSPLASVTEGSAISPTLQAFSAVAHPSLKVVYTTNYSTASSASSSHRIIPYSYSDTTGALTARTDVYSGSFQPRGLAIHKDGGFLVSYHGGIFLSTTYNGIYVFPIDSSGDLGTATQATHSLTGNVFDFKFHPTLDVAYALSYSTSRVSVFSVNKTAKTLTEVGTPVTGVTGGYPSTMTIDPSGKFLFVVNPGTDNVSVYLINSSTGALTAAATPTFSVGDNPKAIVIVRP